MTPTPIDELPLDVLLPGGLVLAALLWLLWALLCRADRVRDREADHAVEQREPEGHTSDQPEDRREQRVIGVHVGSVSRGGAA